MNQWEEKLMCVPVQRTWLWATSQEGGKEEGDTHHHSYGRGSESSTCASIRYEVHVMREEKQANAPLNNHTLTMHSEAMHARNWGPYKNVWQDGLHARDAALRSASISRWTREVTSPSSLSPLSAATWGSTPHKRRSCTRSMNPPYTATCAEKYKPSRLKMELIHKLVRVWPEESTCPSQPNTHLGRDC